MRGVSALFDEGGAMTGVLVRDGVVMVKSGDDVCCVCGEKAVAAIKTNDGDSQLYCAIHFAQEACGELQIARGVFDWAEGVEWAKTPKN